MGVGKLFESRKFLLWFCGIWPEDTLRYPLFSLFRLCFIAFIQFFICVYFVVCTPIFSTAEDFSVFIIEFCAFALGASKILPFVRNRTKMVNLISATMSFDESRNEGDDDDNELEITKFWQKLGDAIGKYLGVSYPASGLFYCSLPFFASGRALPFKIFFREDSLSSPWYEITYAVQMFSIFMFWACVVITDQVYVIFICKLSEEHERLEYRLLGKHRNPNADRNIYKTRKDLMKFVIGRHVDIINFGEEMCSASSVAFLLQHFISTLMICFSAFMYLATDNEGVSKKMAFIMVQGVVLLFIICSAGEMITTRSEALLEALNLSELSCSQFGELDAVTLRQIVLVILRAQKPLRLSVGTFGIINFDLFARTMKGAFSFFTVLRTVYA